MITRGLRILILTYLWVALIEDTTLFLMSWLAPNIWFRVFNAVAPLGLDVAFLRRSAGQWAAFALAQGITIYCWKQKPEWLAVAAGVRFSDLFTDISYILSTLPTLTKVGWLLLVPPPLLNLVGVIILLRGYRQARR